MEAAQEADYPLVKQLFMMAESVSRASEYDEAQKPG